MLVSTGLFNSLYTVCLFMLEQTFDVLVIWPYNLKSSMCTLISSVFVFLLLSFSFSSLFLILLLDCLVTICLLLFAFAVASGLTYDPYAWPIDPLPSIVVDDLHESCMISSWTSLKAFVNIQCRSVLYFLGVCKPFPSSQLI